MEIIQLGNKIYIPSDNTKDNTNDNTKYPYTCKITNTKHRLLKHYGFSNKQKLDDFINEKIKNNQAYEKMQEERKQMKQKNKQELINQIKVGSLLYSSR